MTGTTTKIGSATTSRRVAVEVPGNYNLVIVNVPGTYTGYVSSNTNASEVNSGMTAQGLVAGGASVAFGYQAVNPEDFGEDNGTLSICQLVNESSAYNPDGPYQTNGAELDNAFPYNGNQHPIDSFGAGPTPWPDGDRPSRGLTGRVEFTINVHYTTTEMYAPEGGVDVPLKTKGWNWNTYGAKVGNPGVWSQPTGGITTPTGNGIDFDLPSATWYSVETNS